MYAREKEVSAEDARHVLWYFRQDGGYQPGSFTSSLLDLWGKADPSNRLRLELAFPSLARAIELARNFEFDKLRELAK